jgi:hypothetical protein
MKMFRGIVALLFSAQACTAFAPRQQALSYGLSSSSSSSSWSVSVLRATPSGEDPGMFPLDIPMRRIEGGDSLVTYQMPPGIDRCQMIFKSNGRPLKAKVELWLGPLRRTHFMDIDLEDGDETPFRATLKFKPGPPPVLKVSGNAGFEFPMIAGVAAASPQRGMELAAITEKVWDESPKTLIQGGAIDGSRGAVRTFPVANNVASVQVLFWSRDTGKKSFKALIEVLQGPNNKKQTYDLQCGGGSQPYHAVFQTPGEGHAIRIYNKKFLEDGLFECVVVPYSYKGGASADGPGGSYSLPSTKQWWE